MSAYIIAAIAKNTLSELIHRKIFNIALFFVVLMIITLLWLTELAPGAESRLILDLGLTAVEFFGFLTVILAVAILSFEEIELRTIWLVLVRPVERYEYLIGKITGVALAVLFNVSIMSIALAIICLFGKVVLELSFIVVIFASFLKMLIAISISVVLSLVASTLVSQVTLSLIVVFVGHVTHYIKELLKTMHGITKYLLALGYYLLPNFQNLNFKDILYMQSSLPVIFIILKMIVYSITYTTFALLVSIFIFQRKEFK